MVHRIKDGSGIIADEHGRLWLSSAEITERGEPEIVRLADEEVWFDVIGYSEERRAYLIDPLVIDGAADDLEVELAEHLGQQ